MMKRRDKRVDISGASYTSSAEGVKIRNDIIHIVGSMFFRIILLSIFP